MPITRKQLEELRAAYRATAKQIWDETGDIVSPEGAAVWNLRGAAQGLEEAAYRIDFALSASNISQLADLPGDFEHAHLPVLPSSVCTPRHRLVARGAVPPTPQAKQHATTPHRQRQHAGAAPLERTPRTKPS